MVALVVDNSFSINADIFRDQIVSFWGVVLFVAIFGVYAFGQFFIRNGQVKKQASSRFDWH